MENSSGKNKTQSFIKGALVLAVANLIVKIIGAVFKIPLYGLIGMDGMGYFNVAYQIYTFMFIVATAGFPIAVSKMVAESMARGDARDARRVFDTAFWLLGIIGLIGSIVLYAFAGQLAAMVNNPGAELCIKIVSPAVFFISLVSAFRGYFQGKQNMVPTAFSEVIEAATKLGVGIILASFFVGMTVNGGLGNAIDFAAKQVQSLNIRSQYAAGGAIFGVMLGTFLALVLMVCIFLAKRRRMGRLQVINPIRSRRRILKELVLIAIPITIGASVSSLTSLVDLATVMNRLVVNPAVLDKYAYLFSEGLSATDKANSLYGMYTGQAQTMFNLPLTIVVALGMSVVPAISAAMERKNVLAARKVTESTLRITTMFALPCAIGMSVLAQPILSLLYSDSDGWIVLQKLAIAIIFVSIVQVTNSILQAYGKVYYPVVNMIIGGIAKVALNYFCIPMFGIDGAPLATIVCYGIIAVLNVICIIRVVKIDIKTITFMIKPLIAAAVMGAAAYLVYPIINSVLSGRVGTIAAIIAAGVVYMLVLFLVRAIKREDIITLPKGEKLANIFEKLHLIR